MKLNRCHSGGHSIQQVWFISSGTVPEMADDSKDRGKPYRKPIYSIDYID
jgi:hypothetical protein